MERHVPVRVAVQARGAENLDASEAEGLTRSEGMRVEALPDPPFDAGGEQCFSAREISGQRDLQVHRVSGDGMDADCTGHQQGGLIGEPFRTVGRVSAERFAQQAGSRTLGGLRRDEVRSVHRLAQGSVSQVPDGIGHRDNGNCRPVFVRRHGDGGHEIRGHQRASAVMDDHHAHRVSGGPVQARQGRESRRHGTATVIAARDHGDDLGRQGRAEGVESWARLHDQDDPADHR